MQMLRCVAGVKPAFKRKKCYFEDYRVCAGHIYHQHVECFARLNVLSICAEHRLI